MTWRAPLRRRRAAGPRSNIPPVPCVLRRGFGGRAHGCGFAGKIGDREEGDPMNFASRGLAGVLLATLLPCGPLQAKPVDPALARADPDGTNVWYDCARLPICMVKLGIAPESGETPNSKEVGRPKGRSRRAWQRGSERRTGWFLPRTVRTSFLSFRSTSHFLGVWSFSLPSSGTILSRDPSCLGFN